MDAPPAAQRGRQLRLAQDTEADALLSSNPLALLVGMVLDQQVPMEWAFTAPKLLAQRLGGRLEAADIAGRDPAEFASIATGPPAIHRFPGSMAKRVQALCRRLVEEYGGDAAAVWRDAIDGADLQRRLVALPGFGAQKAKIFMALLGKQLGVQPDGWVEAATPYADPGGYASVADVVDEESLHRVRETKAAAKRAAKESSTGDDAPPRAGAGRSAARTPATPKAATSAAPKPAAPKPAAPKPAAPKPAATKPAATKPAATKPARAQRGAT